MSDQDLIDLLEKMLENAKKGSYSEEIKNEIIQNNTEYVTGIRDPIDKEALKYFVTGWCFHKYSENQTNEGLIKTQNNINT
jgi:hemerythrin-like domain-containing protein